MTANTITTYIEAVLMDKGIIIGAEHEVVTRHNLPFAMFRYTTNVSHLNPDTD